MVGPVSGFRFAGVAAGIKKKEGALDLGLLVADEPAVAGAVFTRNLVRAAPVEVAIERTRNGFVQAVLVNSGNANACTGQAGMDAALSTTGALATSLGIEADEVVPASTGVIGAVLPAAKIVAKVPELVEGATPEGIEAFARAIMTTDRWPKLAEFTVGECRVVGVAKGAGMIHPDVGAAHATMLVFLVTDAVVDQAALQAAVERASELSFNACTVDGDTSTNDMVIALASGRSGQKLGEGAMFEALLEVCRPLARDMVRDGEGAEHAVDITVAGMKGEAEARIVARTVATSMLVKTALYGKDPNWGRLLAAAGRAGILFDPKVAVIQVGETVIYERGVPLGAQAEAVATQTMQQQDYSITLTLGDGPGRFTYMTSDLGHGYVDVNAGYRS